MLDANLLNEAVEQLKADIAESNRALDILLGMQAKQSGNPPPKPKGTRRMSPAGKKRIADAQRARWAKWKKEQPNQTKKKGKGKVLNIRKIA